MRIGFKGLGAAAAAGLVLGAFGPAVGAPTPKQTPYFASISASKARMRTGPARTYPARWLYRRADLPVKVLAVYDRGQWLKIEDPGGTQGWMLGTLISAKTRTALVTGSIAALRESPEPGGRLLWRAAPGVVGRISKCAGGWCWFDARGRGGYVETSRLWGVAPGETLD